MSIASPRREYKEMHTLLVGSGIAALLSFLGAASMGTGWMAQPVEVPVGWLLIGALVLTFVPTLSLVAVVQQKLGVPVATNERRRN